MSLEIKSYMWYNEPFFEVNATIYDEEVTGQLEEAFMNDLPHCREITREEYADRNLWMRIKEQSSRLLSPLL